MNKIEKMAAKDAYEYGLAQMFFGEGAGTRRKLIEATINERVETIPGYERALDVAYGKLSQIEMAEKAVAERKRIDRANSARKNISAFRRGRMSGLTNGVFIAVGVYYVARQTGYDQVVIEKGKQTYARLKAEVNKRRGDTVVNFFHQNDGTV